MSLGLMIPHPTKSTLFPYTTLFRSLWLVGSRVSWSDALVLESLGQAIRGAAFAVPGTQARQRRHQQIAGLLRSEEHTSELQSHHELVCRLHHVKNGDDAALQRPQRK